MDSNTTMTMNASACAISARPRLAGTVLPAVTHREGQGSTLSIATGPGLRLTDVDAHHFAVVTVDAKTYLATDVIRSRSGRPPV
ncbi:MAG: hypothetical protein L0H25_01625 [Micrococcales bacterium]|nr:hypothetical protein [Micrococcales bacterium]